VADIFLDLDKRDPEDQKFEEMHLPDSIFPVENKKRKVFFQTF
jgi:hypothetical protein